MRNLSAALTIKRNGKTRKEKKKVMWRLLVALVVLLAVAAAQDDLEASVDAFLSDDLGEDGPESGVSTTAGPQQTAPPTAATPSAEQVQWLREQQAVLFELYQVSMRRTNETRNWTKRSQMHFQRMKHHVVGATKRFNALRLKLRAEAKHRDLDRNTTLAHAPLVWNKALVGAKSSREPGFFIARVTVYSVFILWLAVLGILMIRHRLVIQSFWVALLVMSFVASVLGMVFSTLTSGRIAFASPLVTALEVAAFISLALLVSIVILFALLLCSALYTATFPDKGPLPRVVYIVPSVAFAATVCYGLVIQIYSAVTGVYVLDVSSVVLYALGALACLSLICFNVICFMKKPARQPLIILVASALLFAAVAVTVVLQAMFDFVSYSQFLDPYRGMLIVTPAIALAEVAVYLSFSLASVMPRKSHGVDLHQDVPVEGFSELPDARVPLRYAEY